MTTFTKPELRAMADKTRAAIGPENGLPQYLRTAMAAAAAAFDFAAEGKLGQAGVQSAVDHLNEAFDKQLWEAWEAFDTAEAGDDPEQWRDSLMTLVPLLPVEMVGVIKDVFARILEAMLAEAVEDFEAMPAASEARQ